jgi:hypothetical protein
MIKGPSDASLGTFATGCSRYFSIGAMRTGAGAGHAEPIRAGSPGQEHPGDDQRRGRRRQFYGPARQDLKTVPRPVSAREAASGVAVFDAVVARPIIADEEAKIDEKGVLRLKGHFETTPKQVKYQLGFIPSDGTWKLSGVTIDIE